MSTSTEKVMDTHAVLTDFFSHHPHFLTLVTEGYPSNNQAHLGVWEGLFEHVFGEPPQGQEKVNPRLADPRPGSTDPRWECLLLSQGYGFMRAMDSFIRTHMSEEANKQTLKEAA